jgi:hypothetical protein
MCDFTHRSKRGAPANWAIPRISHTESIDLTASQVGNESANDAHRPNLVGLYLGNFPKQ